MARKKVSSESVESKENSRDLSSQRLNMEELNEELEKLKSLNTKIVKEAFERKKQVDSLVEAKTVLEDDLKRLRLEKSGFETELNSVTENGIRSEMERCLLCGFIEAQIGGMGAHFQVLGREVGTKEMEIGMLKKQVDELTAGLENGKDMMNRVCRDRDLLKSELSQCGEEVLSLKAKVLEFDKKEHESQDEIGKLKIQCEDLKKREIEEVKKAKDSAEEMLTAKAREIEKLSLNAEGLKGEKTMVENERDGCKTRISELEKEVVELNEVLISSKKEEEVLKGKLKALEASQGEILEKVKVMGQSIDDLEKRNSDKEKEIEQLKAEKGSVLKMHEVLTIEKKEQEERIVKLLKDKETVENEVNQLKEAVLTSKKEEDALKKKILELEANYSQVLEKVKLMESSISDLENQNSEKMREIERLTVEKESTLKKHELLSLDLGKKEEEIGRILQERRAIEQAKICKEDEVVSLLKNVDSLNADSLVLQTSLKDKECKIDELVLELSSHKDSIDKVQIERDCLRKNVDEERESLVNLRSEFQKLEKGIEESARELAKTKTENESLIKEKEDMENCIASLKQEKQSVLSGLSDAQQEISDMKAKSESATLMSQKALAMLRDIASSVCEPTNGIKDTIVMDKQLSSEIEPYATELQAIKQAFEQKQVAVDEMKQQVEVLQSSVEDANRKKGFLTILSSVTTVFAAIFLACGNRIR